VLDTRIDHGLIKTVERSRRRVQLRVDLTEAAPGGTQSGCTRDVAETGADFAAALVVAPYFLATTINSRPRSTLCAPASMIVRLLPMVTESSSPVKMPIFERGRQGTLVAVVYRAQLYLGERG